MSVLFQLFLFQLCFSLIVWGFRLGTPGRRYHGLGQLAASIQSTSFLVYIESTDAFGMMFYANFAVILERSLNAQGGSGVLSSLGEMKLKIPARLGDLLQIKCEPGRVTCSNQLGEDVFIAKQATLGQRRCNEVSGEKIEKLSLVQYVSRYDLWPDEIISDNQFLPTRTIFNLFERARTDVLGGPGRLAGAASAKNHVYVARIKDFRASLSSFPTSAQVLVVSQTHGMGDSIVDFVQQIICPETETVFSSVKVTCVSVDSETKKPTPFSADLRQRLGIL